MTQPPYPPPREPEFPRYADSPREQPPAGGWQPPGGPPPPPPPGYPYAAGPPPDPYGYGYGYGLPTPPRHTNGLAIAALVLGLAGLLCIPVGPVAIGLGIAALVGIRRRQENGTAMAVVGLALGSVQTVLIAVFLGVGLSGGFDEETADPGPDPTPSPANSTAAETTFIGDLTVGTCFDEPDPDSGGDVLVRLCSEPHDGEITAVVKLAARDYPGDRAVQDEAEKSCDREFERYVGISVYKTSLEPNFFYPDRKSWEHGDREVSCVAMGPDREKLDSSVQGSKR